jgi:hypothetical protein
MEKKKKAFNSRFCGNTRSNCVHMLYLCEFYSVHDLIYLLYAKDPWYSITNLLLQHHWDPHCLHQISELTSPNTSPHDRMGSSLYYLLGHCRSEKSDNASEMVEVLDDKSKVVMVVSTFYLWYHLCYYF